MNHISTLSRDQNNLTRLVSRLVEVCGERPGLVVVDPLGGGAVLVVGEHVVVVRVEPGQHGGARGAVEGSLLKFGIKFERHFGEIAEM